MSLIVYLIVLAFTGLVVGALARLALPGRDPMTIPQTMLVGVAGSFAAGLLALLVFGGRIGGGIVLSIGFATLLRVAHPARARTAADVAVRPRVGPTQRRLEQQATPALTAAGVTGPEGRRRHRLLRAALVLAAA